MAIFLFSIYSNIMLIIKNNRLEERLTTTSQEVAYMEAKAKQLNLLSVYYQSASYQEVEARRQLALKKPDETALIIKGVPTDATLDFENTSNSLTSSEKTNTAQSNPARWWQYFFGN